MALIPVDGDIWLTEAETCERLCIEINAQVAERNKEGGRSERYRNISAGILVRLNQFNGQVKELRRKLNEFKTDEITSEEAERRLRQVEILESKRIRLQTQFNNVGRENLERERLLAPGPSVWQNEEDDELLSSDREALLKNSTIQQIKQQNQRVLQEQDEGLESLSKIISRQKDMAIRIHTEVENQTELLDELGTGMDNVDVRLSTTTRTVTEVVRRPSLCGYYLFVLALLLILFFVIWFK